jgi:uridine kinase
VDEVRSGALDGVRDAITARKVGRRPLMVYVSGVDAAGKTLVTSRLAALVHDAGHDVLIVNVDDFHQPKRLRYGGDPADPADQYYSRSYDLAVLVDDVLAPIRQTGALDKTLHLVDLATDTFSMERRYTASPETVVFVDGVFLLRPELVGFGDVFVEVDVPLSVAFARARAREAGRPDAAATLAKYASKYFAAQVRYRRTFEPVRRAQVVIDNRGEEPVVVSLRAEAALEALPDKPLKKDRPYDAVSFSPGAAARPEADITLRMLEAAGYRTEVLTMSHPHAGSASGARRLHVDEGVRLSDLLDDLVP